MKKFIYAFSESDRDILLSQGYTLLKADNTKKMYVFKNKEELQYSLPVDISIDEKTAVEGVTIPFHEGAAAYYEECGINIAD